MIDVLYMAGSGRSGSTLLERTLGQFNEIVAVGELRHLWRSDPYTELCGCGQIIFECPFWSAVFDEAWGGIQTVDFSEIRRQQLEVDRIRYLGRILNWQPVSDDFRQKLHSYTGLLQSLYEAIRTVSGRSIILDSSKDVSSLYLLSTMPDVRLKVLHLVRDSRAVAHSWTRRKKRPQVVDHESYMPVYSPRRSALDWTYRNLFSELARSRVDNYMQLRYEDFIQNPYETCEKIGRFTGIAEPQLGFIRQNEIELSLPNHTVSGNPMRFHKGNLQLRVDNEWQKALRPFHHALVTALTWPLLLRYSYQLGKP